MTDMPVDIGAAEKTGNPALSKIRHHLAIKPI
jgi:hypothetical protein